MTYTDQAIAALERALNRKVWSDPITVMDVQEALSALKAKQAQECQECRWNAGFGARKPVGGHTHPEPMHLTVKHDGPPKYLLNGAPEEDPLPGHASESHEWPCMYFYSGNWSGGGYSGKPLKRDKGTCTCRVDNPHEAEPQHGQNGYATGEGYGHG